MGVTVDLIPRLPGESPEHAIARIYQDGVAIVFDGDARTVVLEDLDDGGEPVPPAPPGSFDGWRAEVLRRIEPLQPWESELHRGHAHLWSAGFGWQVECNDQDITLRFRGFGPVAAGMTTLDDATFLEAFDGLHTILHWPDCYGAYCDLDDPDDRPTSIG